MPSKNHGLRLKEHNGFAGKGAKLLGRENEVQWTCEENGMDKDNAVIGGSPIELEAAAMKIMGQRYRIEACPILASQLPDLNVDTEIDAELCRQLYQHARENIRPDFVGGLELALMRTVGFELEANAQLVAVTEEDGQFIARLSERRVLKHFDPIGLADLLIAQGVRAENLRTPQWRDGDIAPSVGDRIAMFGYMRRHELVLERKNDGDLV